ncbi:MAG: 30S ribosomal protein S20 [Candidatus Nomurabacteria bacterium]|jgi:ribosomal protein S20|nr:30S ribosomal protein S20 [Candidatus Nomurabacteria bacterium]
MPIIKSAKKAARQAVKRTTQNGQIKKSIKNALKDFRNKPTSEKASKVQSEYDKAVKKGLMKKNTASRRKAAVAKFAKNSGVKVSATTKKIIAAPAKKPATPAKKAPAAKTITKKPAAKKPTATKKPTTKK